MLLLDSFDALIDAETGDISDAELADALRTLLNLPAHAVKVIITTRRPPLDLTDVQPNRQARLDLDTGLASPYAENILREMDESGSLGLRDAPAEILDGARRHTGGYPRALEALVAILSSDRGTTLEELLADAHEQPAANATKELVSEAFNRLDPTAQQVLQALAIYGRPASPTAVDYLLQAYDASIDSAPILERLAKMQFVHAEEHRYYLYPVDNAYALSQIPEDEPTGPADNSQADFTQIALWSRGADYFKETRLPAEDWRTIDDLAPQLAEFDLRCAARDFDTAAEVLSEIDRDYLSLWGHYRLELDLNERLQGNLGDYFLQMQNINRLGSCYMLIGQEEKAITHFERGLTLTRGRGDRDFETPLLGNLGICYTALGRIVQGVEISEQALVLIRETENHQSEGVMLNNLGRCFAMLGQSTVSIEHHQRALAINEAFDLGAEQENGCNLRLGERYAELGQTDRALKHYQKVLDLARKIRDPVLEAMSLVAIGQIMLDQNNASNAMSMHHQALKIADETALPELQSTTSWNLAHGHLALGCLPAARTAIETAQQFARQYDSARNNSHNVSTLLGVIALRQDDAIVAREAFEAAIGQAEQLLGGTPQLFNALDAKALALSGLALCGRDSVAEAMEA